jgi:hypothetical protein
MAKKAFLVHDETGREFEVIKIDREANTITLKGEYSTFTDPFDKGALTGLGYRLIQREVQETPVDEAE